MVAVGAAGVSAWSEDAGKGDRTPIRTAEKRAVGWAS